MVKCSVEERANVWTHLVGVLFALLSVGLLWPAYNLGFMWFVSMAVFLLGMLLMFGSSALYHYVSEPQLKARLRKLDHSCIYVMIAGSYTPVVLCVVGGRLGWGVFALMWLMVLVGIVSKLYFLGRYPRLSLALYLVMGWSILFLARPVWEALAWPSLVLLLFEGLSYTAGSWFYAHERPGYHAIWHVFVLFGAVFHTACLGMLLASSF